MASDERCGSSGGIVAAGSFNVGHRGRLPLFSIIQMSGGRHPNDVAMIRSGSF
jgi:hypothetical protein